MSSVSHHQAPRVSQGYGHSNIGRRKQLAGKGEPTKMKAERVHSAHVQQATQLHNNERLERIKKRLQDRLSPPLPVVSLTEQRAIETLAAISMVLPT